MKINRILWVVSLVVLTASSAWAETQNVKVSGSIDAYAFYRENFDLAKNDQADLPLSGAGAAGTNVNKSDADEYFMTITQVQVAADLTDNVSTVVNLINQRDWNADQYGTANAAGSNTAHEFEVALDLAYVQMKEIFYAPLTLTIGRQDLVFGRGFIVGWNPQDPTNAILADEWTQVQSFDALRATLDFNPWTIDFVYSKILEGSHGPEDDRDLYGTNVNYKFAEYNAVAEGYFWAETDRNAIARLNASGNGDTRTNETYTIGGRVQFDPISQITLGGELAYQLGNYYLNTGSPQRDRDAWATDLFGEYRFDNPWKPMLGLQYVMLSGEPNTGATPEDYGSWNGAFRLPVYGWIHDYKEIYYSTVQAGDQAAGQNQQHISLYGSINPMEDLKLTGNYWYFWNDEDAHLTAGNQSSATLSEDIGQELDLAAIYSYTTDVTFSFYANWFFPGDHYTSPNDSIASEYISEVKVVF